MVIKQYRARGLMVDTLLQVVALDDAMAIIAFSIALAISEYAARMALLEIEPDVSIKNHTFATFSTSSL